MSEISEYEHDFNEHYTKILNKIYDIVLENETIKTNYNIHKPLNAIICEAPSRETVFSIDVIIECVSIFSKIRDEFPITIEKNTYSNSWVIMVDKIKYRKYIIQNLLK